MNDDNILILRTFRPLLTFLTLYNLDNFREKSRRVIARNICRAISITVAFAAYVFLFLSSELLQCSNDRFVLSKIAQPLSFFIGGCQIIFIYPLLFGRSSRIIEILDDLQEIVERRE